MRGVHHLADLAGVSLGQPRTVCRADRVGEFGHRLIKKRCLGRTCQQIVELPDDIPDDELGRHDAACHAFACARDHAIHDGGILRITLQVILVIGHRLERRRALARSEFGIKGLQPAEVVDRQNLADPQQAGHIALQVALPIRFEYVVGNLIDRREARAIDAVQCLQIIDDRLPFCRLIGRGQIVAQPIGIAQVPAEDSLHRVAPQPRLVAFLEDLAQLRVLGRRVASGNSGTGRRSRGLRRSKRRKGDRKQQREKNAQEYAFRSDHARGTDRPIFASTGRTFKCFGA